LVDDRPNGEWLAERFCDGPGIGMAVLANRGKLLQVFEYRYARDQQGASFYRVSAPVTKRLRAHCAAFVATLSYTGLAMFEFKGDVLLEVNARPWAGMPLSVALGVDFPFDLYRLLVEGEETTDQSYRAGVYARNTIPDATQIVASARALANRPKAFAGFV